MNHRDLIGRETPKRLLGSAIVAALLIWALAAIAALSSPGTALAVDDPAQTVRVGYYENEVFEEGAQPDAVKTGYAYEYYLKISEYTGWKYEYVYGSFGDLYQKLLDGDIDLIAGLAYKEDRADIIGYPELAMGKETYSLVKHTSDESITADPATFAGKRIGVLQSAMVDVLNGYLSDHQVRAEVVTFEDYEELFAAFDSHEVDILAAEGDGASDRADAEVIAPFGSSDYYLCVNVKRPDLLDALDTAQAQLQVEEPYYLNSLHAKYYPHTISSRALSTSEKEWLAEHDTLRVGYLDNYLPYSGTDDNGDVTGIVKDIVPEMTESLGLDDLEISYESFSGYADMIQAVADGKIDTAFPVGGGLYYSEENGIYQTTAIASAPTELVYKGEYDEGKTESFAVNENNLMQYYYVKTNFPDAEITMYPSIDDCLKAVDNGKAGCTTLNGLRANDILKNRSYSNLSLRQLGKADDRCFGVLIGNDGLLKLLNRGINVVGTDYAANLASRYTDQLYSYSLIDILADNMAIVVTIIVVIAALIIFLLMREARRTKRQKEQLAEALEAAQQASRAKTAFLNNMSHDIRTPMNAVVGFTALAAANAGDKDRVLDYLGRISVSSQHLLSLIDDALDMSRIDSGKMEIAEEDVHLPGLVDELRAIVQSSLADKQQVLHVDMQGVRDEDIVTDRMRLSQVLLNILTNAIKFTPDGGTISFRVTERAASTPGLADFEFRIKDNGIGMSEEFQKVIFEAFSRERTSTVSGIQGTGLGMAISKSIVDMMGGTIDVNSVEGEGSEFIVNIPFRIAAETGPSEHAPELRAVHAQSFRATTDELQPEMHVDFTGYRALLAEDNYQNQQIATLILEGHGMAVEVASNGQQAVDMMQAAPAGHYDLVLMDIQMPVMDGYEATRRIRALDDEAKATIPIVAVTANAFAEDRQKVLDAGMNGYLAKPYAIPDMLDVIAEFIG